MHPAVVEALGSPIKEGFFVSGSTNVNGAAGEANLAIPISGPKGKGTIYVKAGKSLGRWSYSDMVVEIQATRNRIDLLKGPAPPNEF
jgi:Cytochrome oxidase complex assembly protein 1